MCGRTVYLWIYLCKLSSRYNIISILKIIITTDNGSHKCLTLLASLVILFADHKYRAGHILCHVISFFSKFTHTHTHMYTGQYSSFDDDSVHFPTSCTTCRIGRYASSPGKSSCEKCPTGKTSSSDFSDCEQCEAGTFVNTTAGTCEECPSGYYASRALDGACLLCAAGILDFYIFTIF
jgi:hypothetical protein